MIEKLDSNIISKKEDFSLVTNKLVVDFNGEVSYTLI